MIANAAEIGHSRIGDWMGARTPWQRRGIAFFAGALATLGHAPFQFPLAYVLAIMVLVWLLDAAYARTSRLGSAFAAGWWLGLGHFITGLYWASSAFLVESDVWGPMWGVPATFALAAGNAIYWGLGAMLAMSLWTRDFRRIPAFALAMFATEWLRGHLFGGFPWLLPGYVWTPGEPFSQLASVFGIYGLSAITLLLAAAPATMADRQDSAAFRFAPMVLAGLVGGMAWGWGAQRIANAPVEPPGAQPIVRVADSGLSQAEKWRVRPDQEWRVLGRYLAASGAAEDSRASILVWPEGAIPVVNFFMLENQQFLDALGRGLGDRALIVGLTRRELRGSELLYFNSAAVIDGVSGAPRLSQIYDKHHLVPFGEYIPLWSLVSDLNIAPLQRIGAGFESGPRPSRVIVPEAAPAIVLICYEAIFPGMVPRGEGRPGWIVVVTNDAWFGRLDRFTGPWQHFAMARYRSIEEGLPMARAASGGVSGIIDSFGRAVRMTIQAGGGTESQLPPALRGTLYTDWGVWLLLGLLVIIATLRFIPRPAEGERVRA
ncbi:apolipoprotein N-acyltransferase [alpha proteobacterium U9-1i]|nr:apolipoprotein N-acyltransferase [alpha proteobacterium U9-1i]